MNGSPAGLGRLGRRSTGRRTVPVPDVVLLLLLAGLSAPGTGLAGALPDIGWARTFNPVQGGFNKNEPTRVQVALRIGPGARSVPVKWLLQRGKETIVSGDTLISPAPHSGETPFTLRFPALSPGNYVLGLIADHENVIEEKDEMNNTAAFTVVVPNGAPAVFRCEGPEGSTWKIQRLELNTSTGEPYPNAYGTRPDTTRSTEYQTVVAGVQPGKYAGIVFGPSVNKVPLVFSYGSFEMPDPPRETTTIWPRMTPYLVGRPKFKGEKATETVGGSYGAPLWDWNTRFMLEGSVRNPTDRSIDLQYLVRFVQTGVTSPAYKDTLLSLGALATEKLALVGRIPKDAGTYLIQAELLVPWPAGFEDLGEEMRVACYILPLGYIEVQH